MASFPKKVFLILTGFSFLYFFVSLGTIKSSIHYYLYPREGIYCYREDVPTIQDITEVSPPKGSSIFFHETSCNSFFNGKLFITPRQACAVESAALLNPRRMVYLLFASPAVLKNEGSESDRMLEAILTYPNVRIHHLNYEKYTKGTPLEDLYRSGEIETSYYAQSHASDVLRYLTLWKYGGIYLDLDVIVIKSLSNLPGNFAGSESEANVAAGILGFNSTGIGHNLAKTCVNDLKNHFNGKEWGFNGPGVITRLLKNICGADKAKDMLKKDCQGFHVFPPESFYAIPWWNWTMFIEEKSLKEVERLTKKSYMIHVWNKFSSKMKISLNSKVPYLMYANKYCPKVISQCDSYF
ncbi:unnamed protein product [Brassicogethes aeneus]|uniref:Alpha 1,4-glycosyltransferase domain-containing protein n=1 Tax=Brassicogethes aeneus TaxID=1431903 RepID=A0A9P0BK36_BRAAE|nr:unnamed protein product [Brassicogethes aeneus]